MELSVGANDLHLSLHATYCAEDDGSILQAVAKYKPFVDWLTRYQPSDNTKISRVVVRNVQWMAKRIAMIAVDVELVHTEIKGQKLVQSAVFTDDAQTVLMPVLSLNGYKYGVLIRQPRIALGGAVTEEAITGVVTKDGFTGLGSEELAKIGFKLAASDLTALRTAPFSFGEGLLPQTLVKTSLALAPADAEALLNGVPIADVNANGAYLKAVLLDTIATSGSDLKAIVAASLSQ